MRRPRQKGAIEVIVPTRRHSLTGTGAIRTGSTAEAAELAGRAEEVMLLKQPHLHAVWQVSASHLERRTDLNDTEQHVN